MVNKNDNTQKAIATELKEGNENNFGPNKLLHFVDNAVIALVHDLKLEVESNHTLYKKLFEKEYNLFENGRGDFTEILVKYKSSTVDGTSVNLVKKPMDLAKFNNELNKLNTNLSPYYSNKIAEFIKKIVYPVSEDHIFDLQIDTSDFYLNLDVYSAKDLQSLTVEIF